MSDTEEILKDIREEFNLTYNHFNAPYYFASGGVSVTETLKNAVAANIPIEARYNKKTTEGLAPVVFICDMRKWHEAKYTEHWRQYHHVTQKRQFDRLIAEVDAESESGLDSLYADIAYQLTLRTTPEEYNSFWYERANRRIMIHPTKNLRHTLCVLIDLNGKIRFNGVAEQNWKHRNSAGISPIIPRPHHDILFQRATAARLYVMTEANRLDHTLSGNIEYCMDGSSSYRLDFFMKMEGADALERGPMLRYVWFNVKSHDERRIAFLNALRMAQDKALAHNRQLGQEAYKIIRIGSEIGDDCLEAYNRLHNNIPEGTNHVQSPEQLAAVAGIPTAPVIELVPLRDPEATVLISVGDYPDNQ